MAYYGQVRDEYENLTPNGVINSISSSYYDDEIKKLKERIHNISIGKGDCAFGEVYTLSEYLDTPTKREKLIKRLKSSISSLAEKSKSVREMRRNLDSANYQYEKIAEEYALHNSLYFCLREYLMYERDLGDGVKKDEPSETYNDLLERGRIRRSKVGRVHSKDLTELSRSRKKIDKKVYDSLKKNKGLIVVDDFHYSLERLLIKNNYCVSQFAFSMYNSYVERNHGYPYSDNISNFGVKVYELQEAEKIMKDPNYFSGVICNIYREINCFIDNYHIASVASKLYKFRHRFEEFQRVEREIEALGYIISAFKNTKIADSHTIKFLEEYLSKKRIKFRKAKANLLHDYNKSKIKDIVEAQKRLESLYQEYLLKKGVYNSLDKSRKYDDPELKNLRDEISKIRMEMIALVRKYPELNREEYKIDLEQFKKHFKEFDDELVPKKESEFDKMDGGTIDAIGYNHDDEHNMVTLEKEPVVGIKEGDVLEPRVEDRFRIGQTQVDFVSDDENIQRVDVPDYLRDTRSAYYQKYIIEKVKKTELGNLKFSVYLERVAPFQKELIDIEREREEKAATVYKQYLQYLASLKDKSVAMSFKRFAERNYGFEPVDIPVEYDELEKQRKLS